jgi:FKBP-type peptidyl-prolyl cis-trans isomerase FklB
MRVVLATLFCLGTFVSQAYAQKEAPPADKPELKTLTQKMSYIIGLNLGKRLKSGDMELDIKTVLSGLQDELNGIKPILSQEEIEASIAQFEQERAGEEAKRAAAMAEQQKGAGERNKKEGDAFLAENGKKEGVVTLPSGLQYKVLKSGTGETPGPNDTVTTHYRGTLLSGTEFDSSYKRNEPASFPVNRVIAGWTEALQKMKVGDKWELIIPSNLAYGENGAGGDIGPNATLRFEIELLGVKKE